MKKVIVFLFVLLFVINISGKSPKLITQGDKNYNIIEWEGGEFVYITYNWKGGKFGDAIDIIKEFVKISEQRGLKELPLGRFPTGKIWQLGLIIKDKFDIAELKGYKIERMNIEKGNYAALLTKGYPENIFVFWTKFKKWLIKDGLKPDNTVFEIYDKAFNESIDIKERTGQLRYKINK